jgi:uncharacterized protein (DUF305 family)
MDTPYRKLALALSINAIIMYFVMYSMIAGIEHLYNNLNNVYMTAMMAAPMGIVMLLVMPSMFKHRGLNVGLFAGFGAVLALSFAFMRAQAAIGHEQFLRSMIPHHSGAILMCRQSAISDPEIKRLCDQIVRSQREEIAEMTRILARHR